MLLGKKNETNAVIEYKDIISEKEFRLMYSNTIFPEELTNDNIAGTEYTCIKTETITPIQQTSSEVLQCRAIYDSKTDSYNREWYLYTVSPDVEKDRRTRKLKEMKKQRNALLAESDYTQSLDYFYLKEQWKVYRDKLRTIFDNNIDPFLIVFPEKPGVFTNDLKGNKLKKIAKMTAVTDKILYTSNIPSGLGFNISASYTNYLNLTIASSLNVTSISDSSGNLHTVTNAELLKVIESIKLFGLDTITTNSKKKAKIEACTTQAELDLVII